MAQTEANRRRMAGKKGKKNQVALRPPEVRLEKNELKEKPRLTQLLESRPQREFLQVLQLLLS